MAQGDDQPHGFGREKRQPQGWVAWMGWPGEVLDGPGLSPISGLSLSKQQSSTSSTPWRRAAVELQVGRFQKKNASKWHHWTAVLIRGSSTHALDSWVNKWVCPQPKHDVRTHWYFDSQVCQVTHSLDGSSWVISSCDSCVSTGMDTVAALGRGTPWCATFWPSVTGTTAPSSVSSRGNAMHEGFGRVRMGMGWSPLFFEMVCSEFVAYLAYLIYWHNH